MHWHTSELMNGRHICTRQGVQHVRRLSLDLCNTLVHVATRFNDWISNPVVDKSVPCLALPIPQSARQRATAPSMDLAKNCHSNAVDAWLPCFVLMQSSWSPWSHHHAGSAQVQGLHTRDTRKEGCFTKNLYELIDTSFLSFIVKQNQYCNSVLKTKERILASNKQRM